MMILLTLFFFFYLFCGDDPAGAICKSGSLFTSFKARCQLAGWCKWNLGPTDAYIWRYFKCNQAGWWENVFWVAKCTSFEQKYILWENVLYFQNEHLEQEYICQILFVFMQIHRERERRSVKCLFQVTAKKVLRNWLAEITADAAPPKRQRCQDNLDWLRQQSRW